jgi:hypothetical protein
MTKHLEDICGCYLLEDFYGCHLPQNNSQGKNNQPIQHITSRQTAHVQQRTR